MNIPLKTYATLFLKYVRPYKRKGVALSFFLLASIGVQLVNPQILRYFIDAVTGNADPLHLTIAAVCFLVAAFANQGLTIGATYRGADLGWSATNLLREDLAEHCLELDMSFHNERTPGELIERIDGDVTALANFFSQFIIKILGAALLVIGIVVILLFEDWRVGLAILVYAAGAIALILRLKNVAVESSEKEREANATLYGFLEERLAGLDDIRANGGGGYVMQRFHGVLRTMFHRGRRAWMKRSTLWIAIISLFAVGDAIAIGMGVILFRQGLVTLGTVFLFFQYTQTMWTVVEDIIHQMQDLQKAGASIGRVMTILAIRPAMQNGAQTLHKTGPLEVEFDDVTFGYGSDTRVLKNVSFKLLPGTVLGLLGRTGSGKSTIVRLLFRLYDTAEGTVRVGGLDLRNADVSALRKRVAMVTQDVQLFHASVRDNLTFFDRSISDARISAVIEELGLSEWYNGMPDGLDTELTAGGGGLSAGEAQLVAFTRVFLQDPGLVILDEPSSRMDRATEQLLERSMLRLLENRTAIIIAHRLSTVRRADEIMIIEGGEIEEYGLRAELENDHASRFAELLASGLEVEEFQA